ncbi:MAG: MCE family protein [Candidatus Omnitrophica bacterium]|nr:MCE family protein [Candidatus Omnitrophota bacterium]
MKLNNETKVGLMIVSSLVILLGITIKAGNFNLKKDGYRINTVFTDIDGIKLNSPVMFNGLEVGRVESINIQEEANQTRMVLTLWIGSKIHLHEGTKVFIKNLGFMGEKYIALVALDSRLPLLNNGAMIQGQSPVDFNQILSSGQELMGHLNGITTNVEERLKKNQKNIDEMMTNFNTTSRNIKNTTANLNEMSADLKGHPWKLFFKGPSGK